MNCSGPGGGSHIVLVGILSDTHDQVRRTKLAVAKLKAAGAEALLHCGDITIADVVYECGNLPSYFVFGNCDFDRDGLRKAILTIGATCLEAGDVVALAGRKVAITHGDSEREIRRLKSSNPDYFLSGHTHRINDVNYGSMRCINPGALHRASTWTVVLLDLVRDDLKVLPISDAPMQD